MTALQQLLHRVRTGSTTADDAGRIEALLYAAHNTGYLDGCNQIEQTESIQRLIPAISQFEGANRG